MKQCLFVAALALSLTCAMGQTFSLDSTSPSLGAALLPDDVLNRFPTGEYPSLAGTGVDVDAFSYGKAIGDFSTYFPPLNDIFYSVNRGALGVSGTPVRVECEFDDSAACDIFRLRLSFGQAAIALIFDGDGSTGDSMGLVESPVDDNLDALDMKSAVGESIYFSVAPAALSAYPRGTSAADILVMRPPAPGYDALPPAVLYASASDLGLSAADDVDALTVFDNGDGVFSSGVDIVVFSLAPASPYVGTSDPGPNRPGVAVTAGDLLVDQGVYGLDGPSVYIDAGGLGLSAVRDGGVSDDDLDAVDIVRRRLGASIGPKWQQRSDCQYGLNVQSWRVAGGPARKLVVDDWLCDGRPVTSVEWQGSYQGWAATEPDVTAPPVSSRPDGFMVSWYAQAGPAETGPPLRQDYYALSEYARLDAGGVAEFNHCVIVLPAGGYEHVYSYEINFPNAAWHELAGRVYRLSIEAVYTNGSPVYPWAWATALPRDEWGSPAFQVELPGATNVLTWPPPEWRSVAEHPYAGRGVSMAFSLLTDVWPARCRQWRAETNTEGFHDAQSWEGLGFAEAGTARVEDFVSDGRPLTDIRWWGGYMGWQSNITGNAGSPIAPPGGRDAPLGFVLRLYEDDGVDGGPGALSHEVLVDLDECHETFHESRSVQEDSVRHEYVYLVDLMDREVGGETWSLTNGAHGWLGVQAVFPAAFTRALHTGWAWSLTGFTNGLESRVSLDGGKTWTNGSPAASADLAFQLGTDSIPGNGPSEIIFTDMTYDTAGVTSRRLEIRTDGHCGCGKQVLQSRGDLMTTGIWTDVESRVIPGPGYTWSAEAISTQKFYRVRQDNL